MLHKKTVLLLTIFVLVGLTILFKFTFDAVGDWVYQDKMKDACEVEMRRIYSRFIRYAITNKLDLPQTLNWCDTLDLDEPLCPVDYFAHKEIQCSYAINKNIEKYSFKDLPDSIVLFFESDLGWNGVGDRYNVNYSNHDDVSAGIIFANGSIAHIKKETVENLRWE
ncbi:MAG TPA: hypothetical protein P5279_17820 [Anaerohalosphaeraceae bacterium]|nr:hypothetical protein [Anaerohalosphaeraceae bacterium]HRT52351.1 hypothetical protein [Anaerohalosphaeraceae bacterium]HRT88367.1 hypothetical protein [Anaerohalosphaeraceae bacterium]